MVELQLGGIEQLCALFERQYLGAGRAGGASRAADAGDVIVYDWDGDGAFQHSTIVTAFDAGGKPLVNAHTVSSRHRYWDYWIPTLGMITPNTGFTISPIILR